MSEVGFYVGKPNPRDLVLAQDRSRPIEKERALSYPFHDGKHGPFVYSGWFDSTTWLDSVPLIPEGHVAVLACGSNASPDRLSQKFRGMDEKIYVFPCNVQDYCSVYASYIAPYGSIPATFGYERGAVGCMYITYMSLSALQVMHASEGVQTHGVDPIHPRYYHEIYGFFYIETPIEAMLLGRVNGAYGYVTPQLVKRDRRGWEQYILLPQFPAIGSRYSPMTQSELHKHLFGARVTDPEYDDLLRSIRYDAPFRQWLTENHMPQHELVDFPALRIA